MSKLSIITVNVRGLGDSAKRTRVFSQLRRMQHDIIALQETHCPTAADATWWTRQWGGNAFWTTFDSRSVGVAILVRRDLPCTISDVDTDPAGRFVRLTISLTDPHRSFRLTAVYAPNTGPDRVNLFSQLHDDAAAYNDSNDDDLDCIICGDFNCIVDPTLDKVGGTTGSTSSTSLAGSQQLSAWTSYERTTDAWRLLHPLSIETTWRQGNVGSRIDRIYVSRHLLAHTHSRCDTWTRWRGLDDQVGPCRARSELLEAQLLVAE